MPFTGVPVRPFTVDYQNKGFENAQYNITSAMTFLTPGGATPRVDFCGKQVAARYVYWTADNGAENGAGWYLEAEAVALPQDARAFPCASVADERGPLEPPAPLLHERGAVRVALAAELALPFPVVEVADADPAPLVLHPGRASVGDAVGRALVGLGRAGPDLPRDRRPLSRFFRGRPPPALRTDSRRA